MSADTVKLIITFITGSAFVTVVYYIWGALHGERITNLISIEPTIRRSKIPNESEKDYLIALIKLKKGSVHALKMLSLTVAVLKLDQKTLDEKFLAWRGEPNRRIDDYWMPSKGQNRSLNESGCLIAERHILAIWSLENGRPLNLAPLEETQYESVCTVKNNETFEIIVTLQGERYKSQFAKCLVVLYHPIHLIPHILGLLLNKFFRGIPIPRRPAMFSRTYWTASAISIPLV